MLRSLIGLLETRRTFINALPPPSSQASPAKEFIREGEWKTKDETGSWCPSDLNQRLSFPADITTANLRPDPVLWSSSLHMTHIVKLTVASEDTVEETVECKSLKYRELAADAEQLGYKTKVLLVEVGCGSFVGKSATRLLLMIPLEELRAYH